MWMSFCLLVAEVLSFFGLKWTLDHLIFQKTDLYCALPFSLKHRLTFSFILSTEHLSRAVQNLHPKPHLGKIWGLLFMDFVRGMGRARAEPELWLTKIYLWFYIKLIRYKTQRAPTVLSSLSRKEEGDDQEMLKEDPPTLKLRLTKKT